MEQKEKGITNTVLEKQLMNSIPSSSTYENIAYPKKNRLDGQIDLNGFFFAAGTSSLPFASNTNPTFLSLCLAKNIHQKLLNWETFL